jgi:site-specific DNA recombinase
MLEIAIWEKVKNLLKNPEMIKKEYQRRISENKNDESPDEKFARTNKTRYRKAYGRLL